MFFTSVPEGNKFIIYRFGKFDRIVEPGLRWIPPFDDCFQVFTKTRFIQNKDLSLLDKHGNPIIVSSIVSYNITNPRQYVEKTNFFEQTSIIESNVEVGLRETLKLYPFISPDGDDILKNKIDFRNHLIDSIYLKLEPFGINVDNVTISEAKYAPEISSQMLAKQQARAYVEARKLIVQGAMDTVNDVSTQLNNLSPESKEKITVNLLTILAGNSHAQPTINV